MFGSRLVGALHAHAPPKSAPNDPRPYIGTHGRNDDGDDDLSELREGVGIDPLGRDDHDRQGEKSSDYSSEDHHLRGRVGRQHTRFKHTEARVLVAGVTPL
jgi:hypothetical protein